MQDPESKEDNGEPDRRLEEERFCSASLYEGCTCSSKCCRETGSTLLERDDNGEEDPDDGVEDDEHQEIV